MQRLDAHCHFWRIDRGDYGWLDGNGGPLAPIRRDFAPVDFPGKGRAIVVQAAPTIAETDYLLGLAEQNDFIAGVVGWVDLSAADALAQMTRLAQNPWFKGLRPMLQDIAATDWLLAAPRAGIFDAMLELGLRFDALVTSRHLAMLKQFADRHPQLPIIIDHAAKPQADDRAVWAKGMQALAADKRIHCKLSGLLTEFNAEQLRDPLPALQEILAQLLNWFGPERLVWGSDWPVLNLAGSYASWQDMTDQLLATLSQADQTAILYGNAARFYGVDQ